MHYHCAAALLYVLALSACATAPPVTEVRLVGKAFDDLSAASAPLFDDFAVAERKQGQAAANSRAARHTSAGSASGTGGAPRPEERCPQIEHAAGAGPNDREVKVQNGFCVEDSYYYSEITDPPATAAFRRSLSAAGDYTRVLLILAEGRNVEPALAQIQSLASNVGGTLQLAGAGTLAPGVAALSSALQPVLELAARNANTKELARNVKEVSPQVIAVLAQMRISAPEMFTTLVEPSLRRLPTASAEQAAAEVARIEAYRTAVSNYVVLLDQYEKMLERLVATYDTENRSVALAGLVQRSAELSAQADAWRRTFTALRLGLN